ncbi:MAG: hypothetical protein OEV66_00445 [Spirochaetia bacterium]|nr:hypothetical protein [Spirochaetia bacterium]
MQTPEPPLTTAISPCPNDTFVFYHFLNDPQNKEKYQPVFLDIEELNLGMINKKWDIVKASFPMGAVLEESYELLPSGSALGYGVGPVAVYRDEDIFQKDRWIIGLPGEHTTAHFLWNYYFKTMKDKIPQNIEKKYLYFGAIMEKTASGDLDMGIIIHEGRFVFKNLKLKMYRDLGEFWEKQTGLPAPLGGIFIRKDLPESKKKMAASDLKKSVSDAMQQKSENSEIYQQRILPYIKKYSQELPDDVVEKHIEYYVNADTVELSPRAREAINLMFSIHKGMEKNGLK